MTFPGTARVQMVMNLPVCVDIRTALPDRELTPLLDDAFAWLRRVEGAFHPAGENGRTVERIPEVVEALRRCDELSEEPGGWGERLDPATYVRGWAVERLSRALATAGAVDHRVTAGSGTRVRGSSAPGRRWRVGMRDPYDGVTTRVLFAHDAAVATAGGAQYAGDGRAWVCVVGPDLGAAGAYAAAMHAMGTARARRFGRELAAGRPYQSMVVGGDGRVTTTPGFTDHGVETRLAG